MRKPELVNAIAEQSGMTKEKANEALTVMLKVITNALESKEDVSLIGFGSFVHRTRGARKGKNPQTGETIDIKASNTVAFKPGKLLKQAVNS